MAEGRPLRTAANAVRGARMSVGLALAGLALAGLVRVEPALAGVSAAAGARPGEQLVCPTELAHRIPERPSWALGGSGSGRQISDVASK